jgi:hypothetical protein
MKLPMDLNPKVKDYLQQNKNITLLGLFWAMYWRWTGLIALIYLFILIAVFFLAIFVTAWMR